MTPSIPTAFEMKEVTDKTKTSFNYVLYETIMGDIAHQVRNAAERGDYTLQYIIDVSDNESSQNTLNRLKKELDVLGYTVALSEGTKSQNIKGVRFRFNITWA